MTNRLKIFPALGFVLFCLICNAVATTYIVDAPGKLTAIAAQIQAAPPGGTQIVQFKTYVNVGTFSLMSLTADSLIFQRAEESAEVVEFSGTLFQLKAVSAKVIVRNLAFKAKTGNSIFIDGAVTVSPNSDLLIDSCQVFGDSLNNTFISWLGISGSKIEIKRSIFSASNGTNGKIDATTDSLIFLNDYLNFEGLVASTTVKSIVLKNVTSNRVQYKLSGDFTGVYSFLSNIFGNLTLSNKLPGNPDKYIMTLTNFAGGGGAQNNSRFNSWAGFDYPNSASFQHPTNTILSPFVDSNGFWSFKQATETTRGYQNPISLGFPSYNNFPGDSTLKTSLSSKDSVELILSTAQIPRVITASYGTITYPTSLDSTRSLWLKDTILQVTGPTTIKKVFFPLAKAQGKPILYSESAGSYLPNGVGSEGTLNFLNTQTSSKKFIPSFAGQNTFRGSNISVTGITVDTSFTFTSISRSGRTSFQSPVLDAVKKRIRVLTLSAKPFGFRDTTTAEGSGSLRFGFTKTGVDLPYRSDSLSWTSPSGVQAAVTDSAGKFWGTTVFSSTSQALLIERLGIGSGKDTVVLAQGRVLTTSTKGHQISVDSSFVPTVTIFPDMGNFSKGISLKWPGRATGDSLYLELKKSSAFQKAYLRDSTKGILQTPAFEDTSKITLALALADSNKVFFLARKYSIPASIKSSVILAPDTLKDILSSTPGDFSLDTLASLQGLPKDSLRILLKRRFIPNGLSLSLPYSAVLQGLVPNRETSIRFFSHRGTKWDSIAGTYLSGFFRVSVLPSDSVIVVGEKIEAIDTLPVNPIGNPKTIVVIDKISLQPTLTTTEEARLAQYYVETTSIDPAGKTTVVVSKALAKDTVFQVGVNGTQIYSFRIGYESLSGKITWKDVPQIAQDPTAFFSAAAAAARVYQPGIWELVGFPWAGNFNRDIREHLDAADLPDVAMFDWTGKWNPLSSSSDLVRGSGYRIGFPKKTFSPRPPPVTTWSFDPDTLVLDTGWSLISNPFPFPIPDTSIGLDKNSVSYFYALSWNGTGKTATSIWNKVDTLKPFMGYAVHTKIKSNLIFKSPLSHSNPVNKISSSAAVPETKIQFLKNGSTVITELFLVSKSSPRPSPVPVFFNAGVVAHWDSAQGLQTKPLQLNEKVNTTFTVQSLKGDELNVQSNFVPLNKGEILALWNPGNHTLTALSDKPKMVLAEGTNTFGLVSALPTELESLRKTLIQSLPETFTLLGNFPNPFQNETSLQFSIPFLNGNSILHYEVRSLSGRLVYELNQNNLTSGNHTFTLATSSWPLGQYFLQLSFTNESGTQTLKQKLLHLGGSR